MATQEEIAAAVAAALTAINGTQDEVVEEPVFTEEMRKAEEARKQKLRAAASKLAPQYQAVFDDLNYGLQGRIALGTAQQMQRSYFSAMSRYDAQMRRKQYLMDRQGGENGTEFDELSDCEAVMVRLSREIDEAEVVLYAAELWLDRIYSEAAKHGEERAVEWILDRMREACDLSLKAQGRYDSAVQRRKQEQQRLNKAEGTADKIMLRTEVHSPLVDKLVS